MKKFRNNAFTLIELLVVISIIAILAGIALPVFGQVQIKGAQTKALSNAKQIATALKLYAVDNNGTYPAYGTTNGAPDSTKPLVTANDAFSLLIPDYVPNEDIFWLAKSGWCLSKPNGPDNKMDKPGTYPPTDTLAAGENEYTYVPGLSDTSNASMPLLADGFANNTSHTYTNVATKPGGVWKGKNAIVIHVDTSGVVAKCDASFTVLGYNGTATPGDIFSTANGSSGWLDTPNATLPPK